MRIPALLISPRIAPGTVFQVGTTTVNCTVRDAVNNLSAVCSFPVIVNRVGAPTLSDPLACTGPGNTLNGSFTVATCDTFVEGRHFDLSEVPPTSHPLDVVNVWGADEPHECLSVQEALANAPEREGDFFKVPPGGS